MEKTISDFDDQWSRYTDNSGYYGSVELFADIVGPNLDLAQLKGATVVDIGSGTGRIVRMLHGAGAGRIHAVEPAPRAFAALLDNTRDLRDHVVYHNDTGDHLPSREGEGWADYVFSIGVVHHIPKPDPVMVAAHRALRPGGKCVIWLYGKEGNELYLTVTSILRKATVWMPHWLLAGLSLLLTPLLAVYIAVARIAPLPMRDYCLRILGPMTWAKRYLIIYDQLNPEYAKYYTEAEAHDLLARAGFTDIRLHHRHGYSWTAIGTRE